MVSPSFYQHRSFKSYTNKLGKVKMAYDFRSIFIKHVIEKKGVATYLSYKMTQLWPNLQGLSLLTLGQACDFFPKKETYLNRHIHGQFYTGAIPPSSHQTLCYFSTSHFPFQECSFNRIIYIHDPKITKPQIEYLLRSCWKALQDHGKIILLLPNSLGWWSWFGTSFFKRNHNAFHILPLNHTLKQHMFQISHSEGIIYLPPKLMNLFPLRANRIIEFLGLFFIPFLGGYHLIEIEKDLYAPITVARCKKQYILRPTLSRSNYNHKDPS